MIVNRQLARWSVGNQHKTYVNRNVSGKMEKTMKKRFDVLYYKSLPGKGETFSHKYTETWETTRFFCPKCGERGVWFRNDGGDYYIGEQYICIFCKSTFYLPDGVINISDKQDTQRLEQLTAEQESEDDRKSTAA